MKVTVFTSTLEGLLDEDYSSVVYEGELTKAQIEKVGREYGSGYPRMAVLHIPESNRYLITYNNDPEAEPTDDAYCEDDDYSRGKLQTWVEFAEIAQPPVV